MGSDCKQDDHCSDFLILLEKSIDNPFYVKIKVYKYN